MLLIALALAQAAPFDTKANFVELARAHCRGEWPADFQMQEFCLKGQAEGMLEFKRVSNEIGKPLEKTLEKCTEQWTKNRLPDWQMIGFCAKTQADAYRRLSAASP